MNLNHTAETPPRIPDDDPQRTATIVTADSDGIAHISLAGDTYTILLKGDDTAGRYTLIDMHVPPGGGPPPHRHDFEEMFTVLDGEVEVTFRGETTTAAAGTTVNVPANAPPQLRKPFARSGSPALYVYAARAGGALHGGRGPRSGPNGTPSPTLEGSYRQADGQGRGSGAEVRHRVRNP